MRRWDVHTVEVEVGGTAASCRWPPSRAVVRRQRIETTRLALHSFPTPLMGRNLMAHLRSDFTVRIKRSALPPVPSHVQTGALLIRGPVAAGRFHVQVTASTHRQGSDALLFRDDSRPGRARGAAGQHRPAWITITFRGIGEMLGDRHTTVPNGITSWIDLSPCEADEFGVPRAFASSW